PKDRRPADRAEAKRPLLAFIRDTDILRVPACNLNPLRWPSRLYPERASGPALAGEAITHRDPHRVALRAHPQLAATAHGFASLHARILRDEASPFGLRQEVAGLGECSKMTLEPIAATSD